MNLFEFPLYETKQILEDETELENVICRDLMIEGTYSIKKYNEFPIQHKLTHQTLYASFWIVKPNGSVKNLVAWEDLKQIALPVLLQNFVDKYQSLN
jgi:A/G-specific adenine glycosylase